MGKAGRARRAVARCHTIGLDSLHLWKYAGAVPDALAPYRDLISACCALDSTLCGSFNGSTSVLLEDVSTSVLLEDVSTAMLVALFVAVLPPTCAGSPVST